MQVRYFPGRWPEADITATPVEFATLAARVDEVVVAGSGEVVLTASGDGLAAVVVRVGAGPVVVVMRDDLLSVTGDPKGLGLFARNLPIEPSLPVGYHVHFEHAGREWFVSEESVPLVLTIGSTASTTVGSSAR